MAKRLFFSIVFLVAMAVPVLAALHPCPSTCRPPNEIQCGATEYSDCEGTTCVCVDACEQ